MPAESVSRDFRRDGSVVYRVDGETADRQAYLEARAELLMRNVDRRVRQLVEETAQLKAALVEAFAESE
jgi:hypothetical protein